MSAAAIGRFARHYVEMVAVMLAGMLVLFMPADIGLAAMGVDLGDEAPQLLLLGMGVSMTVPMVAWMLRRGHGARPSTEMALSMLVPTFAAMALLAAGGLGDVHGAMMLQHVVMFPAMLGVMLLRFAEYAGCHPHAQVAA
jgi:uncharacterized membrane protein YhaH (DUF805 family)